MKYSYQIIFLTILSVLNIQCNAKEKRTKQVDENKITTDTTIKLTIFSPKNSFAGFHYFDQFGNLNQITLGKEEDKIKHKEVIRINKPTFLYYSTAPTFIPLLIYPGDSLNIEVIDNKITITNQISGVDATLNIPIKYSVFAYESIMTRIPINKRELFLDSCYLITKDKLIKTQNDSNKTIIQYYLKSALYKYLQYKLIRKAVDKSESLKNYIDSIAFIVNDDSFCYSQDHKDLVRIYSMTLWGNDYKNENHHRKIYDSSKNYFQGDVRNYKLFNELNAMRLSKSIYFNEYRKLFLNDCSNQELSLFVQQNFKPSTDKLNDILLTYQNKKYSFSELINDYKGNVIFIDFWASWCLPCRKEIPFARDIIKKYNKDKFKYMFVSIDENFSSWLEAVTKEDILKINDSYVISNITESSLIENYQIKSVPRYLLFDKAGKLVSTNAVSPSDPKLTQLIKDLLK